MITTTAGFYQTPSSTVTEITQDRQSVYSISPSEIEALRSIQTKLYEQSRVSGWHKPLEKIEKLADFDPEFSKQIMGFWAATKIALIHSEVSEALEGVRKDLMDDHLKDRKMVEVELADAVIRILDMGGAMGLDIAGAIAEKNDYNASRADHKLENRAKQGGKSF